VSEKERKSFLLGVFQGERGYSAVNIVRTVDREWTTNKRKGATTKGIKKKENLNKKSF
jgi:hypothetical protein